MRTFVLIPGEIKFQGTPSDGAFEEPEYTVPSTCMAPVLQALVATKSSPGAKIPATKIMVSFHPSFLIICNVVTQPPLLCLVLNSMISSSVNSSLDFFFFKSV